jgi:cell wall-associated NlpC family hydrolase
VSEALHYGGYPFRSSPVTLWASWWWHSTSDNTRTWWDADSLEYFLVDEDPGINGNPGGYIAENTKGALASDKYNALSKGDLLFFDWEDNGSIDHVRIEVGWGTPTSTGYQSAYNNSYWTTGDWANQHTVPRYKDFWNAYYQLTSSQRASVRILQVHIYSTN